jgi:hypothetical protein
MTEELKKQIEGITATSLQEGFEPTLQDFEGVCENYEAEKDEQFDRVNVTLQFTDVKVNRSTEPYPFPIAQIRIPVSKQSKSGYGFFIKSLDKLIPGGTISSLIGKRVRMVWSTENFGRWRGEEEDRIRGCWHVTELIGAAAAGQPVKPAYKVALEMAVGRNVNDLTAFYQEVFKRPELKTPEGRDVLGAILNKTFIPTAIERGELVADKNGMLKLAEAA